MQLQSARTFPPRPLCKRCDPLFQRSHAPGSATGRCVWDDCQSPTGIGRRYMGSPFAGYARSLGRRRSSVASANSAVPKTTKITRMTAAFHSIRHLKRAFCTPSVRTVAYGGKIVEWLTPQERSGVRMMALAASTPLYPGRTLAGVPRPKASDRSGQGS
jgi:hypothetical protein